MKAAALLLVAQASEIDVTNAHKLEQRWGFLKNIVNIDRFFSAGGHGVHHHSNHTVPASTNTTNGTASDTATKDLLDANEAQIEDLKAQIEKLKDNKYALKEKHEEELRRLEDDIPNQKIHIQEDIERTNAKIVEKGHEMAAYSGAGKPTDAIFRLQAHGYPKIEGHFNLDGTHIKKVDHPIETGQKVILIDYTTASTVAHKHIGWKLTEQISDVSSYKVNFWIRSELEEQLEPSADFGVKFGSTVVNDWVSSCKPKSWCWVSVSEPAGEYKSIQFSFGSQPKMSAMVSKFRLQAFL